MDTALTITKYIASVLAIVGLFVEIAPIKISPLAWIGRRINRDINKRVESMQSDLQEHIADDMRTYILDFQNQCLNKRKHTLEEFKRAYKMCDKYERYIEENNLKNSEATDAIAYIKRIYNHCLDSGDFVIGKEDAL